MTFSTLPSAPLWLAAVATLLVAAAALAGAVAPMALRRLGLGWPAPANDNELAIARPRSRLQAV